MNTQTNFNFLQKPLCPSFTQLLIKFSQMNFLRVPNVRKVDFQFSFGALGTFLRGQSHIVILRHKKCYSFIYYKIKRLNKD